MTGRHTPTVFTADGAQQTPDDDAPPAYVRFTPYEDTCTALLIDPPKLIAECSQLLADMDALLAPSLPKLQPTARRSR